MLKAIARIVRTPDLLRKIAFTLGLIAVYRMGAFVPAPGVDYPAVQQCLAAGNAQGGLYSFVNMFSGGALLQVSVFALGIMPYITASIIVQLLRVVIPRFEQLHQEGPQGQATLTQYTRYLTLALALLQATTTAGTSYGRCTAPPRRPGPATQDPARPGCMSRGGAHQPDSGTSARAGHIDLACEGRRV